MPIKDNPGNLRDDDGAAPRTPIRKTKLKPADVTPKAVSPVSVGTPVVVDMDKSNSPTSNQCAEKGSPASTRFFSTPLSKASTIQDYEEYQRTRGIGKKIDKSPMDDSQMGVTPKKKGSPITISSSSTTPSPKPKVRALAMKASSQTSKSPKTPKTTGPRTPSKGQKKKSYSTDTFIKLQSTDGLPVGFKVPPGVEVADEESDEDEPMLLRLLRRKAAIDQDYRDFRDFQKKHDKTIPVEKLRSFEASELTYRGWRKDSKGVWGKPGMPPTSVNALRKYHAAFKAKFAMKKKGTPKSMKAKLPKSMKKGVSFGMSMKRGVIKTIQKGKKWEIAWYHPDI